MSQAETHVVLLLDLASENPIHESTILAEVPDGASATLLRLTDYSVSRCDKGSPEDWPPVIAKIDELVHDARAAERGGARCRYWIAGRAGLPAFFHLGYRLTKKAAVTLLNPRDAGPLDVLDLNAGGRSGSTPAAYFAAPAWPNRPRTAPGTLGLLVSSRHYPPEEIEQLMSSRGEPIAAVIEAQATGDGILDEHSIIPAVRELNTTITDMQMWYPGCTSVAVFVRGPVTLAFLAGRFLNPHIFPNLQVFQHRNQLYELAYAPGRGLSRKRHTILLVAANPVNTTTLAIDEEDRAIRDELRRGKYRERFAPEVRRATRHMDLLREVRELQPTIVQFSGHGESEGLFFQADDGAESVVSREDLRDLLASVAAPVQIVILNACYSDVLADALLEHVPCVIGMDGSVGDVPAQRFAVGFYGGLAGGASVASAFEQGRAAYDHAEPARRASGARDLEAAERIHATARPILRVRPGFDASKLVLAGGPTP